MLVAATPELPHSLALAPSPHPGPGFTGVAEKPSTRSHSPTAPRRSGGGEHFGIFFTRGFSHFEY